MAEAANVVWQMSRGGRYDREYGTVHNTRSFLRKMWGAKRLSFVGEITIPGGVSESEMLAFLVRTINYPKTT